MNWPRMGTWWTHLKRKSRYKVVGKVWLQCSTRIPKDGDRLVLYMNEDGVYSARLPSEFLDGRFEEDIR